MGDGDDFGAGVGHCRTACFGDEADFAAVAQGCEPLVYLLGVGFFVQGVDGDFLQRSSGAELFEKAAGGLGVFGDVGGEVSGCLLGSAWQPGS